MGAKAWSQEEEDCLVSAYSSGLPLARIAEMLPNRTQRGIANYALKIGVAPHKAWTPEEDAILAEIWNQPRSLKVGMRRLPGRTYDAARVHAASIGLGTKKAAQKCSRSPYFNGITAELKKGEPLSTLTLSRILNATRRTIQRVMQDGHGPEFHIGGWRQESNGSYSRLWALGPGIDAPKPEPKPVLEVHRDYRMRKRIKRGLINPFSTAAGLIAAPQSANGRVFIHLHDDEANDVDRKLIAA